MAHFAEVDENNIVKRVIVAEQDFIDSGVLGDPKNWIQTSYNTRGGVHYAPNSNTPDNKKQLRKNYASVGYTYDKVRDAFIPPKPSTTLNFYGVIKTIQVELDEETCLWKKIIPDDKDGTL